MQIRFEETFRNILHIKLWHFADKSVLRHLAASIMIASALRLFGTERSIPVIFLLCFPSLLAFSLIAILLSAFLSARKGRTKLVNFDDEGMQITDPLSDESYKLNWSEVRFRENRKDFFISSDRKRNYHYWIPKAKLDSDEMAYMHDLLGRCKT